MTQYGATHRLLVEHEDDGLEDVEVEGGTREAHVCRVFYYIEHPEDCYRAPERQRQREEAARRSNGSINSETESQTFSGRDDCPIDHEIEAVGLLDALGVSHWASSGGRSYTAIEHLQEGVYELNAWYQRHSGPEGDDWSGGLEHERVPDKAAPPAPGASISAGL